MTLLPKVQPPSGRQFEIAHGDQRAVVVEVGGGVRSYSFGDRAVIDGYDEAAMCDGARGQTLVPWPNRVKDGKWSWRGRDLQLALTEPEQHNAIHGLSRWTAWSVIDHEDSQVSLRCTVHPQPGYPWTVDVTNLWSLSDDGLSVTTQIINNSNETVPIGAGFHPYITVGTDRIDDAVLHLPAATRLPTGDQQIPTGREPVSGTEFDFMQPRRLGAQQIDHTYTDQQRDENGVFRLSLTHPTANATVSVWLDEAYPFVEVFTGDALPNSTRRRQGLGIEPMTAPPNALASGESLVVLEPGASWQGSWGIMAA